MGAVIARRCAGPDQYQSFDDWDHLNAGILQLAEYLAIIRVLWPMRLSMNIWIAPNR